MTMPLSLEDLTVAFGVDGEWVPMVRGVDLSVERGEIVGLVGESGSGKTLTALSIAGLLPAGAKILSGSVRLGSEDLLRVSASRLRQVRASSISMVFQEPITALNPVLTVGYQIRESLQSRGISRREQDREAKRLLDVVEMPASRERLRSYPHELSGGQRQRVMIAMALASEPELLIADEPTSALDVTVQAEILRLLQELRSQLGLAILLITHDLTVVARVCDRTMVMYAGQIVEQAPTRRLFASPAHPYSEGLIASVPRVGHGPPDGRIPTLPGQVPDPRDFPSGCAFHPRCGVARPACADTVPRLVTVTENQEARCILHEPSANAGGGQ